MKTRWRRIIPKMLENGIALIILLCGEIAAGDLTGVVRSSGGAVIDSAKIIAACTNVCADTDSVFADTAGEYRIAALPMGTYRITCAKSGYYSVDTAILMGDPEISLNFTLNPLPNGTLHSGVENGIWLPTENPHLLMGDVTVSESLYIAPGCSVISSGTNRQIKVSNNARLRIGQKQGNTVFMDIGHIASVSNVVSSQSVLIISNANIKISEAMTFAGSEITIDSSEIYAIRSYAFTANKILISGSCIKSLEYQQGMPHGSYITITGGMQITGIENIVISDSKFSSVNVFIDCPSSRISRCFFSRELSIWGAFKYLWHCYAQTLKCGYFISGNDSLYNNIIISLNPSADAKDTIYRGGINYCIIENIPSTKYFGFLQNIRLNRNGDSCDLWYNMHAVPLSAAVGAASDGTNIGLDQTLGTFTIATDRLAATRSKIFQNSADLCMQIIGIAPKQAFRAANAQSLFDLRGRPIAVSARADIFKRIANGLYIVLPGITK